MNRRYKEYHEQLVVEFPSTRSVTYCFFLFHCWVPDLIAPSRLSSVTRGVVISEPAVGNPPRR